MQLRTKELLQNIQTRSGVINKFKMMDLFYAEIVHSDWVDVANRVTIFNQSELFISA